MSTASFSDYAVLQSGVEVLKDLSDNSRQIAGTLQPSSRREALQQLAWARKTGQQLHPVSCGNNWGFGSKLPIQDGVLVFNLGKLRKITLHLERDFAEVEPGVTQGDLHDALVSAGDTHYFNVTGAGRNTSVLGNALERGIGYFGSKKDDLLDLEIMSAEGDLFWTKDQASNPHHPGLGPDLTGAFLQSGWGVVLNSRIRLRKRPPYMGALVLQLSPRASAPQFFAQIALLCREGFISSVPHIANKKRMLTTFGPYLTSAQLSEFDRTAAVWSCFAPVSGSRPLVEALLDFVLKRMEGLATCRLVDQETCKKEPFLVSAVDLALGRPNDFALLGVTFSVFPTTPVVAEALDNGRAGLIHITPTCPVTKECFIRVLDLIEEERRRYGISNLPMTVNLINAGVAAIIISVPFERENASEAQSAKAFANHLLTRCFESGFAPYRLGLKGAPGLMSLTRRRILNRFQGCIDPSRVIAPSRYECLWKESPEIAPITEHLNSLSVEALA